MVTSKCLLCALFAAGQPDISGEESSSLQPCFAFALALWLHTSFVDEGGADLSLRSSKRPDFLRWDLFCWSLLPSCASCVRLEEEGEMPQHFKEAKMSLLVLK